MAGHFAALERREELEQAHQRKAPEWWQFQLTRYPGPVNDSQALAASGRTILKSKALAAAALDGT